MESYSIPPFIQSMSNPVNYFEDKKIINNFDEIYLNNIKEKFINIKRVKIDNFLDANFAEALYAYANINKDWVLASGIDKVKYEKSDIPQNNNINQLQIKNVNKAFGDDHFCYHFYRKMNEKNMSYFEFALRSTLNSEKFITLINNITNLKITKLNTLFMSKYKNGDFLSPHSDRGNGRLAFVINLTKNWKPQYGGNLHFMNDERTEIIDTFVAGFNNLTLFYVPEENGIPHYVGHVAPNVKYPRIAISGWFE